MSNKGTIKHVFPGGNTSKGFYSYYDHILGQQEAKRIICLKGGPGTGKSTFMKKIGEEMVSRGYDVEYMHCSSDNNSLDGVVIKDIKVALLDGTAPHVVDPKNPGAVDEIIHLGDYWNEDGLRFQKQHILKINTEIGKHFARAYKYLAAAKCIYDDITIIHQEAMDNAGPYLEAEKIVQQKYKGIPVSGKLGQVRKLFASAITPNGLSNYLESVININQYIYRVEGKPGTGTDILLSKLVDCAIERGLDVEAYYCPMEPEKRIEHVIIPALSLAFTTSNQYHTLDVNPEQVINLNKYINQRVINEFSDTLTYNITMFNELLEKAIHSIATAKKMHDELERSYIPNMKFDEIQVCWENTLQRVLKYAKEADA